MSESIEHQIEQVINNLLPETAFDGKWLGTANGVSELIP